jgi:hypothetical protein
VNNITTGVAMINVGIESKSRCPSQRPTGFEIPSGSCIVFTEDSRSLATYRAKKDGKTAFDAY